MKSIERFEGVGGHGLRPIMPKDVRSRDLNRVRGLKILGDDAVQAKAGQAQ